MIKDIKLKKQKAKEEALNKASENADEGAELCVNEGANEIAE